MPIPGPENNDTPPQPAGSLEPYAQLIRSLMPRASSVFLFDADGKLEWSSEPTIGPDLENLVDDAVSAASTDLQVNGQMRLIEGNVPVYLCWLRDEEQRLLAVLAVLCRRGQGNDSEPRAFSFVQSLLRPALECLRRDLLSRAAIEQLHDTVSELDRDLELLLSNPSAGSGSVDRSSDELKSLVEVAVAHLKCNIAALIVPQKGVALLRCGAGCKPDAQLLARTHRQLISMAQMRAEPMIINRLAPSAAVGMIPYRILSCPVRHPSGRTLGVLALFREHDSPEFGQRDARLAEVMARRAAGIVESQFDGLSGLYTRAALEQRARGAIAERGGGAGAWSALYIDADQLHVINDNFGMHVGDEVIGQLGELIRSRLPPGALAARISGDRFAALLPSDAEAAAHVAEGLRAGAELLGAAQPNGRVHVSVSIGVAPLETGAGELSHALAAAESACKAAKDRGRNRVAVYEANDVSVVRRFADINLAARLRDAIDTQRLRLDAQLIVPFEGAASTVPHYELLLRMIGEDGATLGPDSFLSAANRYQLMPTIDRWVIERTIFLLRPHAALLASRPAVFAVNFSGQSLNDPGFADFMVNAIETSGLDPSTFCFELTESATIANVERAELLMRRLRRLGCGVALDDFGTGLSSLSYLRQLPVTILKIDGSFVRDILRDSRAESMVRAIAQLARNMSLMTVAEYVETEEIRARIATLGVDYGQGFAIGRPEPFGDVLEQLPMLASASPAYVVEEATGEVPTLQPEPTGTHPQAVVPSRPVIGFPLTAGDAL